MADQTTDDIECIAVVGITGRFPGADNIHQFWDNIKAGRECISFFSKQELLEEGIDRQDINKSSYVRAKGYLEGADCFDRQLFNYSPKEAKLIDPQQRLLLEMCYESLVQANIPYESETCDIGLFLSASFNTYLLNQIFSYPKLCTDLSHYQLALANSNDFLATRIAYKLGLRGPAQTIQTACSSSLVALHYARQSLLNYETDIALAGGISITAPLKTGYVYQKESIKSPDGHCRPFDKDAKGCVPGNGGGVVVLKRYSDAIADNDPIFALLKGSAINNDGNQKASFTAPSASGQANVIRLAMDIANIPADTIDLVETHGTGTILGDPIEIEGLRRAFGTDPDHDTRCALTSTKANIGHLDAAAGVVGFIKAVLAIHHKQIPPSINFNTLNPNINLEETPFYVSTTLQEWTRNGHSRRAGVSSFGIGGTNAHVIIEEVPDNIRHCSQLPETRQLFANRERYWIDDRNPSVPLQTVNHLENYSAKNTHTLLLDKIKAILCELMETDEIDITADYDSLGVDSLMLIDFQCRIEKDLGFTLSSADLEQHYSVSKLHDYLKNKAVTGNHFSRTKGEIYLDVCRRDTSSLAVTLKRGNECNPPLFCIHPAGGYVAVFKDLVKHIDPDQTVIGINAKGWNNTEEADKDIETMAQRYLLVIKEMQPDGPYLLCGSSLGGLVAYEIAQILRQQGEEVKLLALIDSPSPSESFDGLEVPNNNEEILKYINTLSPSMAQNIATPMNKEIKNFDRFFYLWRCHRDAIPKYYAMPYRDEMIFFKAKSDSDYLPRNPERDWITLAEGGIEIHPVPGNHLTMHLDPNVRKIASVINKKLGILEQNNATYPANTIINPTYGQESHYISA